MEEWRSRKHKYHSSIPSAAKPLRESEKVRVEMLAAETLVKSGDSLSGGGRGHRRRKDGREFPDSRFLGSGARASSYTDPVH
jgi:hypothetical protein